LVPAHVNAVLALRATPGGLAVRLSAGVPAVIVTDAVCVTFPPAPVQASVKLELAVNAPVLCVPDVPFAPLQPPDAVQLVAFVALQVSCEADPDWTLAGSALRVSVGAALVTVTAAVRATEPPAPAHVRA
jgi:hypothetical protein